MNSRYHLIISCPDRCGIVAKVSQFIACHNGMIIEADHHTDLQSGWFFMRYEIDAVSLSLSIAEFTNAFAPIAKELSILYSLTSTETKKKVLLLASKESHCLEDILYRTQSNEINCQIVAVASNHNTLAKRTSWYNVPYHHIPINNDKSQHFQAIEELIEQYQADTIVLARYMQILPVELCDKYMGKIINIHHSFLPSFIGANPYKQAYQRGVKLIGATSHYATKALDEGPIITQGVEPISHRQTLADYIRIGKDVERKILASALKSHLEDRVIIHNNRTIVFN